MCGCRYLHCKPTLTQRIFSSSLVQISGSCIISTNQQIRTRPTDCDLRRLAYIMVLTIGTKKYVFHLYNTCLKTLGVKSSQRWFPRNCNYHLSCSFLCRYYLYPCVGVTYRYLILIQIPGYTNNFEHLLTLSMIFGDQHKFKFYSQSKKLTKCI